MLRSLKVLGFVGAIASIFLGAIAKAENYQNAGYIYIDLPGESPYPASFDTWAYKFTKLADACGTITYKHYANQISAYSKPGGGGWQTFNSLPIRLKPSCVNGVLSEARTADFRTSEGEIVFVGIPASSAYTFEVMQPKALSITPKCGFAKIKLPKSLGGWNGEGSTLTVNGQSIFIEDLPTRSVPDRCYTINNQKVRFTLAQ